MAAVIIIEGLARKGLPASRNQRLVDGGIGIAICCRLSRNRLIRTCSRFAQIIYGEFLPIPGALAGKTMPESASSVFSTTLSAAVLADARQRCLAT